MSVDIHQPQPDLAAPEVLRRRRTPSMRWWHEVLVISVGYAIYTLIRDNVPTDRPRALRNAAQIERIERSLHIFSERAVNVWLAHHEWLAVIANYWYALAHFVVTVAVAVWLLWKHPRRARPLRIAWYSMNLFALAGFAFYPLAPPRFRPGFIDTVVQFGTWGSWGKHGIDAASNQYAAMPSMHIGWSTWCAVVIAVLANRWWVKLLGIACPIITLLVVVGTANHYLLDVAGGLVALALGFGVQRIITRAGPFTPEPAAAGELAADGC